MPTLLRVLIDQRDWHPYLTFKAQYEKAARELADLEGTPHLAGLTLAERTYERWYSGVVRPVPDARRVLVHLFGYPVEELLSEAPPAAESSRNPGAEAGARPTEHRGVDVYEMGRQAVMAASRALRFAVAAESNQLGAETLSHISDEVRRIAAAYPRVPLHSVLGDLIETQDLTFQLLESGRAKPGQSRDLYLMASMACGMLAKASHDLGDPQSAMGQARSAYICADQADHWGMRAWTRGLQSLIAYWAGQPERAVNYAANGIGLAEHDRATGTVMVWLASLEARAHALLGASDAVKAAGRRAAELRDQVAGDDLDAIGGILTFPRPRQLYYTAEAEVLLDEPGPLVEQHAAEAVSAYKSAAPEEWAFGDEAGAWTNLALARLGREDVEGASDALRPVLDLPPAQHNAGIVLSAQRVHTALCHGPIRGSRPAKHLRGELELFISTPTPALPR